MDTKTFKTKEEMQTFIDSSEFIIAEFDWENKTASFRLKSKKEIIKEKIDAFVAGERATQTDVILREINEIAQVLSGIIEENPALLTNAKIKAGVTMFAGINEIRGK